MTTAPAPAQEAGLNPNFSSGPCAKRPGYSLDNLKGAPLGRSHRAKVGKVKLKRAIDLTRDVLGVPADYRIGIVPASDTGAVEMAMWSLLGARGVDMLAWESFGEGWVTDVAKQLKLQGRPHPEGAYGELPDLAQVNFDNDVVFTWNGTTSGVRVPNADWIPAGPQGPDDLRRDVGLLRDGAPRLLEARCRHLLLAEGAGRRGRARHADPQPARRGASHDHTRLPWPMPKIFRMTNGGKLDRRHLRRRHDQYAVDALR
jgi:phosphoserine aminotransferase